MAGRKVIVPIPPEELKNMLEISKNPPKPEVILQKKDDRTPTHTLLHITADDFAEVIDNQKAEAKQVKRVLKPLEPLANKINIELINEEAENRIKENTGIYVRKGNIRPIPTTAVDTAIKEEERAKAKATNAETNPSSGGYKKGKAKAKDKYTVKELKTIASRNNIKTTKKLDGKTVPLNKKGLMAKLKRNKVI